MQLTTLLPTAALAWSASAFLLPPDVHGEALEAFKAVPGTDNHWTARVDCEECPEQADGFRTSLELDFSTNADNEITLGGVAIYPPRSMHDTAVTVKQVLTDDASGAVANSADDYPIGSRMDFGPKVPIDATETTAVPFRMEVLAVQGKVVHVDSVTFSILEDSEGHVYISNPDIVPSNNTPLDQACGTVFCRVKAQMMAKVAMMKSKIGQIKNSCMRKMGFKQHGHGGHRRPEGDRPVDRLSGGPKKFHGKFGKKPCPGKMGKHHGFLRRVAHFLVAFTRLVLMPILIGVAAGMAVSALGMVIGQLFFMIWMRLRSRRHGNMFAVYHIIENSDEADAEQGFDEPLPKYEEKTSVPPAYTDEKIEGEN